jgi:hypothetical protein
MPHCRLWNKTDWEYAFDSIELAAQLYERQDGWPAAMLKELCDRERVLGTTLDYRRSLRIRYVAPASAAKSPAAVSRMADYRGQ